MSRFTGRVDLGSHSNLEPRSTCFAKNNLTNDDPPHWVFPKFTAYPSECHSIAVYSFGRTMHPWLHPCTRQACFHFFQPIQITFWSCPSFAPMSKHILIAFSFYQVCRTLSDRTLPLAFPFFKRTVNPLQEQFILAWHWLNINGSQKTLIIHFCSWYLRCCFKRVFLFGFLLPQLPPNVCGADWCQSPGLS